MGYPDSNNRIKADSPNLCGGPHAGECYRAISIYVKALSELGI